MYLVVDLKKKRSNYTSLARTKASGLLLVAMVTPDCDGLVRELLRLDLFTWTLRLAQLLYVTDRPVVLDAHRVLLRLLDAVDVLRDLLDALVVAERVHCLFSWVWSSWWRWLIQMAITTVFIIDLDDINEMCVFCKWLVLKSCEA